MSSRVVPVAFGPATPEAVMDESASSLVNSSADILPEQDHSFAPESSQHKGRLRSMSHSLLGRRPRLPSLTPTTPDNDALSPQYNATFALSPNRARSRRGLSHSANTTDSFPQDGAADNGGLKRIFRRASTSLKSIVPQGHRHSVAHVDHAVDEIPTSSVNAHRPGTSHSTWHRLRQAASFRHSRTSHGAEAELPTFRDSFPPMPMPGSGNEPPIIPRNTGAAAKAAAAAQNESLGLGFPRQMSPPSLQNKFLKDFGLRKNLSNDRESGVGITVAHDSEIDLGASEALDFEQDANISRVDFVSQLPVELSIKILAFLDARGISSAARVNRAWNVMAANRHVWRDAFLRVKTGTYATSSPVRPGTGRGVPAITPGVNWRDVYRAKEELDRSWKAGQAKPVYLNGHMDSIYCLQFDETKIVTGSRDQTIRIWDLQTLQCRLVIGPPEVVNDASLLLDDEGNPVHFATTPDNPRASTSMPACVSFPTRHEASILCLQYDDRILVTGSSDSSCIMYSVKSGYRPIRRLSHHTAAVLDLAFDDRHIVTCSKDTTICVWDRHSGQLLRQLRGHAGPVNAVQLRGNTIVSCSGDFRVKLWNVDTGKNIREFVGHSKGLACSQFSEDGRFVASAGNDKVIRIWDANTGECVREIKAHDNLVRSLHVDSVTGRLISGSYDTDIKVFDMETGRPLLDFPKWHASWVLSAKSDYRRIVSTGQDPKILIMDFGAHVEGIDLLATKKSAVEIEGGYI